MIDRPELSVVMPCLDEEDTIGICVEKANKAMKEANIDLSLIHI